MNVGVYFPYPCHGLHFSPVCVCVCVCVYKGVGFDPLNTEVEEYMISYLIIYGLAVPRGMRDLNFPTRDRTRAPCSGSVES